MESEVISNAQSLRVIGQHLHNLVISSFKLEKRGDHYIVIVSRREPASVLYFNSADICSADIQARLPRCAANSFAWTHNLSSSMRVLGDYLDRKGAKDFVLSWFPDSVQFRFNNNEEQKFSIHQNLYDLGVCMYMRRSAPLSRLSSFKPSRTEPTSLGASSQFHPATRSAL
jgi:hypothetical protein